jgi:hypothetical protein
MSRRRRSTIVGQFIPHRLELVESPAWRVLSLSARRLLDRIEIEMCHHGGCRENGRLPVTYGDFENFGIHSHAISPAIREVTALGLVVVTEQGRGGNAEFRKPSNYRLTYINTKAANPAEKYPDQPTDDWKHIETVEAAEHIASMARAAGSHKKQKPTVGKRSVSLSKTDSENGKVPLSETTSETPVVSHCRKPTVLSILSLGAGAGAGAEARDTGSRTRGVTPVSTNVVQLHPRSVVAANPTLGRLAQLAIADSSVMAKRRRRQRLQWHLASVIRHISRTTVGDMYGSQPLMPSFTWIAEALF